MKKLMFILASLCMASCSTLNTCNCNNSSRDLAIRNRMNREETRAVQTVKHEDLTSTYEWFY